MSEFRLGDRIWAHIEECHPNGDILVEIDGQLIRVHNETQHRMRSGERLQLEVTTIDPLGFRWIPPHQRALIDKSV